MALPVQPKKRFHHLAQILTAQIESGALAVDARLPTERDLARDHGMSRTTVREALMFLDMAGLIDIRGRAGVFVRRPSPASGAGDEEGAVIPTAFEIIDARLALEPEVAATAAAYARAADFAAMEAAIAAMVAERDRGQAEELADRGFHLALAEASGNQVLAGLVRQLWNHTEAISWQRSLQLVRTADHRDQWIDDHLRILSAIRAGNRSEARKAMKSHLLHVRQVMLRNAMGRA